MKNLFKKMDGLTRLSLLIFLLAAAVFGSYYITVIAAADKQGPVINIESDKIEVSVKDDKESLLRGVTAVDAKDGDVTSSIMIESLSNFIGENERTVTYVAVDKNNNVTSAKRRMTYTDYTPPEFRLSAPLRFPTATANLLTNLSAKDCLDGDITSSIKITSAGGFRAGIAGDYDMTFQASNSAGDVAELTAKVTVYNTYDYRATEIVLTKYLVYLDRGAAFDSESYLKNITINGVEYDLEEGMGTYGDPTIPIEEQTIGIDRISVTNDVDTSVPGTYDVLYSFTMTTISGDQIYGEVHMPVIVRDN